MCSLRPSLSALTPEQLAQLQQMLLDAELAKCSESIQHPPTVAKKPNAPNRKS